MATVEYVVTLIDFQKNKDAWKLRAKDSFDEATRVKTKATEFFQMGKYELAIKMYERANTYRITRKRFSFIVLFSSHSIVSFAVLASSMQTFFQKSTVEGARDEFKISVLLNIALSQMKLLDFLDAKRTVG